MGAAVVWLAVRRPFRVAVEGESMAPTLRPGDFLIAVRSGPIRRGALAVVELPNPPRYEVVKRMVGVPGDSIEGGPLSPGEFWMLGDNPAASTDSRTMGPVRREAIRGVVRFRYWPPGRIGRIRRASPSIERGHD